MAILMRHKDSIYGLNPALTQLQTNITNESNRATAEEVRIEGKLDQEVLDRIAGDTNNQSAITAEVSRATAAEGVLQGNIDAEEARALAAEGVLQGNINAEQARATAAEQANATAISNEVTRATAEETAIRSEVTTAVSTINSSIANETAARIAEDTALDARLDVIEAGLVAGVVPMGSFDTLSDLDDLVEANLVHGWAYYINDNNDLMLYVTEGTAFDYQPTGFTYGFIKFADYTELSGLVNAEQARAVAVEAGLQSDINDEIARATAAEGVLTASVNTNATTIADETTRATAEEARIEGLVNAEQARATAAEGVIAADLASEVTRATAEEARIDAAKLAKASNLSDLVDVSVARTNIDVYSKGETAAAITAGGATPMNEVVTVASGKVVLTYAPKSGVNGIMNFSTVRYTDSNGVSYDAPVIATANTKEFTVSTDTAGQWDGYSVQVQYLYSL
jgi:hypothetical protein